MCENLSVFISWENQMIWTEVMMFIQGIPLTSVSIHTLEDLIFMFHMTIKHARSFFSTDLLHTLCSIMCI